MSKSVHFARISRLRNAIVRLHSKATEPVTTTRSERIFCSREGDMGAGMNVIHFDANYMNYFYQDSVLKDHARR